MYNSFRCKNCDLWKTNANHIIPKEPSEKLIMLVLSNPTLEKCGNLESNSAYKIIFNWLDQVGISKDDVYCSSLTRCYFDRNKNDVGKLKSYYETCFEYVKEELKIVKPKLIITFGRDASELFGCGKDFLGNVGKVFDTKYGKVVSTYTPLYVERPENKNLFSKVLTHLTFAKTVISNKKVDYDYRYVKTLDDVKWLFNQLNEANAWSFDIEGTTTDFLRNELIGIGFSWKRYQGCYLPIKHYVPILGLQEYWNENQQEVLNGLQQVLNNDSVKVAQNGKYDVKCLMHEYLLSVNNYSMDSLLLGSIVNPGKQKNGLDERSNEYVDLQGYKADMGDPNLIWRAPLEKVAIYNNKDTDLTFRITEDDYEKLVKNEKQLALFTDVMMPLNDLVMRMEYQGIKIDTDYALAFHTQLFEELVKMKYEIETALGVKSFNIRSSEQLGEILFGKLKLPILKRTKKDAPATGKEVLKQLLEQTQNPVLGLIMKYKTLAANKGNYVDGFVPVFKRKDNKEKDYLLDKFGYFHGNYKLTSSTGRMRAGKDDDDTEDSDSMQLQNIPRDVRFRQLFLADEGHLFFGADRAQIELRVLAHICQDHELLKACNENYDLHSFVGSMVAGVPYEVVFKGKNAEYKSVRDISKNVGFGWIYGAAPGKFAPWFPGKTKAEKELAEAKGRERYFEKFSRVAPWRKAVIEDAREKGYIQTLSGRIMFCPNINYQGDSKDARKIRSHAERQVVNGHIQGPASDMTVKAGVEFDRWLSENNKDARVLNFVHDAIYGSVNADKNEVKEVCHALDECMLVKHFGVTAKLKNDVHVWSKAWEGQDVTKEYL
jgi:DNA polymerase-1